MFDKLILIIDTEKDFLRVQKIGAEKNSNINLINASNEIKACEILKHLLSTNNLPNLILIDINFFTKTTTFLKLIKENKKLQIIPLIVLGEFNLDIISKENYYNCVLPKPSEEKEFEKVIQSIFFFWFKIAKLPSLN